MNDFAQPRELSSRHKLSGTQVNHKTPTAGLCGNWQFSMSRSSKQSISLEFLAADNVLVGWGYCNIVPHTEWLQQERFIVSLFRRLEIEDGSEVRVGFFRELCGRICLVPHSKLLVVCWPSWAFFGFCCIALVLCLHLHVAFSLYVCVCLSISVSKISPLMSTPVLLD